MGAGTVAATPQTPTTGTTPSQGNVGNLGTQLQILNGKITGLEKTINKKEKPQDEQQAANTGR